MPAAFHVKVKNTTGKDAADLHITFRGSGGSLDIDPASVRPRDGKNPPKIPSNGKPGNEGVIEWSTPAVAAGATVDFDVATDFGPLEFESGYWTGLTEKGAREKIGKVNPEDIQITAL